MPKTASEDLELVSMRFPAVLLKKVRTEAEQNRMALAHEARTAFETFYLVGLPPPMIEMLEEDRKTLGLSRQAYFLSLLDSRCRALLAKEAGAQRATASGKRGGHP